MRFKKTFTMSALLQDAFGFRFPKLRDIKICLFLNFITLVLAFKKLFAYTYLYMCITLYMCIVSMVA